MINSTDESDYFRKNTEFIFVKILFEEKAIVSINLV